MKHICAADKASSSHDGHSGVTKSDLGKGDGIEQRDIGLNVLENQERGKADFVSSQSGKTLPLTTTL